MYMYGKHRSVTLYLFYSTTALLPIGAAALHRSYSHRRIHRRFKVDHHRGPLWCACPVWRERWRAAAAASGGRHRHIVAECVYPRKKQPVYNADRQIDSITAAQKANSACYGAFEDNW